MRIFLFVVFSLLAACSSKQVSPYGDTQFVATDPDRVVVYMSEPDKPFEKIGAVSVKEYKPGFSDPTVIDAHARLKEAAAELGANGIVIISSRSNGERAIIVEGEAIKFLNE